MKTAAMVCNAVLFAFTCLVLVTDGAPTDAAYIVLALVMLLVPIFSLLVMSLRAGRSRAMRLAAIAGNAVLLGGFCWAFVAQYPHPAEEGFVPYAVLSALTPIINLVALVRSGRPAEPALT